MLYDIIIVGNSPEGAELANLISSELTALVISKKFKTPIVDYVACLTDEVIWISYKSGIVCVSTFSGQLICAKKVVIATGSADYGLITTGVATKLDKLSYNVNNSLCVYGEPTDPRFMSALLSNKLDSYKKVYVCFDGQPTPEIITKLQANKIDNKYTLLLNSSILQATKTNEGFYAELSTYNSMLVDELLHFCKRSPIVPNNNILATDKTGKILVKNTYESVNLPLIYAIGDCCSNTFTENNISISDLATSLLSTINV